VVKAFEHLQDNPHIIVHGFQHARIFDARGITRPNMIQQVSRAQHGPTYNGPIYLYRLSILSGRAQQTFSRTYALLGPAVDTPLFDALGIIDQDELPDYESDGNSDFEEDIMEVMDRTSGYLNVLNVYSESKDDDLSVIVITSSEEV